ncbi:MAG TPA: hypothetical protein EYQ41_01955 [Micavibrio sp.]|nr:hypothetical protein [Micavibrio sp.]
MKSFLKENFVLVLGISLPMLLVIGVMALQSLTRAVTEPPQYGVLFTHGGSYASKQSFDFDIQDDGQLTIIFELGDNLNENHLRSELEMTLYHYDPKEGSVSKFKLEAPKDFEKDREYSIEAPSALAALRFDDSETSPDGYIFDRKARNSSGGLFTEMFGYRRYRNDMALIKGGYTHDIPDAPSYYNTQFIGWVKHD